MMKKYVFEPAGMINSYMDTENGDFAKIPWNKVHAGLVTNQAGEVTCRSFQIPTFEAGGVVSTMADVTRFWYELFHGKIIHTDSLTKMIEKKPDGKLEEDSYYAAGIVILPTSFVDDVYSHSGGLPAQSSLAGYSKDQDGGKAFARITSSLMSLSAETAKEEVITPNASTRNLVLHEGADSVGSRLEELESKIPRHAYALRPNG